MPVPFQMQLEPCSVLFVVFCCLHPVPQLDGIKQFNIFLEPGSQNSIMKVLAGLVPSEDWQHKYVPCLILSF